MSGEESVHSRIRRALPSDAPALAELRYAFRTLDYPAARAGTAVEARATFLARCVPWMDASLRREGPWHCWVLPHGSVLGGQIWLQAVEKIPNPVAEPEKHAYITNFYVAPELRGRGAGSALLAATLAWSREHGVDQAFLWPTPQSRPLYARHGFAPAGDGLLVAPVDGLQI